MSAIPGLRRSESPICSAALERFELCPGSAVYVPVKRPKIGYPLWHGIFIHRFLEYCQTKGHAEALAYIRTKKMKKTVACCEAIDVESLPVGRAEVGFAHDPHDSSGREVPLSLYDTIRVETEQYGKADIVLDDPESPLIGDYKCGDKVGQDPASVTQLLGLAAAYQAVYQTPSVDVAIINVHIDGSLVWRIQNVDNGDLERYTIRAKNVHRRVLEDRERANAGIEPDFVVGDKQCGQCPLRAWCPPWNRETHDERQEQEMAARDDGRNAV